MKGNGGNEKLPGKNVDIKVEIGALELLMGQEEAEVCLRYILTHARRRGSRIFEIFSTKEETDHMVASRSRWLAHEGKRGQRCKEVGEASGGT